MEWFLCHFLYRYGSSFGSSAPTRSLRPGEGGSVYSGNGGVPGNPSGPSHGQQAYGNAAMPDNYQMYPGPSQQQAPSMFTQHPQTQMNTQWQSDIFNNNGNNQKASDHETSMITHLQCNFISSLRAIPFTRLGVGVIFWVVDGPEKCP